MSGFSDNCPILEQTADGANVGRCWLVLNNGMCPRHGDVGAELFRYRLTGNCTLESEMRARKTVDTDGPNPAE